MSLYQSTARIEKVSPHERRGVLPTGETVTFGVHGPIAAHYKLPLDHPLPLPVDYIVAATGG